MEATHTPGPWKVEYPTHSRRPKVTAQKTTICDVGFELMEREVDHANAILIAAAPETARRLAEAEAREVVLREALSFCQSVIKSGGMHDLSERMAYDRAEAALRPGSDLQPDGLQEMAAATPEHLQEILQNALHAEYMRPCDERP